MMWKGAPCSCWMMNSPRSASQGSIPCSERSLVEPDLLRDHGLPFDDDISAPRSLASFTMYSLASSAVRAQKTFAPLAIGVFLEFLQKLRKPARRLRPDRRAVGMAAAASGRVARPTFALLVQDMGHHLQKRAACGPFPRPSLASSVNFSVEIFIAASPSSRCARKLARCMAFFSGMMAAQVTADVQETSGLAEDQKIRAALQVIPHLVLHHGARKYPDSDWQIHPRTRSRNPPGSWHQSPHPSPRRSASWAAPTPRAPGGYGTIRDRPPCPGNGAPRSSL